MQQGHWMYINVCELTMLPQSFGSEFLVSGVVLDYVGARYDMRWNRMALNFLI